MQNSAIMHPAIALLIFLTRILVTKWIWAKALVFAFFRGFDMQSRHVKALTTYNYTDHENVFPVS